MNSKTLDLGCGAHPRNPFKLDESYGIDLCSRSFLQSERNIKIADLSIKAIPFSDDFFDAVTAFDFIEHIPRVIYNPTLKNSFVDLMTEISRVLKPGGLFFSSTPCYPSPAAFQDPTHVNIITEKTFLNYFCVKKKNLAKNYGYSGALFHVGQQLHKKSHLRCTMQKLFEVSDPNKSVLFDYPQRHPEGFIA